MLPGLRTINDSSIRGSVQVEQAPCGTSPRRGEAPSHKTHAHGPSAVITVSKTACPRQGRSLNEKAWNNNGSHDCASFCWFLRPVRTTCALPSLQLHRTASFWIVAAVALLGVSHKGINGDCRGKTYGCVRGEILRPQPDELMRRHLPSMSSLIKNQSVEIEDD